MTSKIDASLFRLKQFIEIENYEGFDPYDALSSPLFRLPLLRSNYTIRFLSQQLVKRSPLDLRTLLKIKKGTNPVTLGLCINGYVNLMRSDNSQISAIDQTCHMLIGKLSEQIPNGYTGACWGYDFPWQSKHFALKAFEPSIVASGIIANGLFEYYKLTKNENVFSYCKSVCDFIINDINHIDKGNNKICFSYTTKDTYCVYNAAMKGVRILSQVYSVTKKYLTPKFSYKCGELRC